jgi:hypothetical protein
MKIKVVCIYDAASLLIVTFYTLLCKRLNEDILIQLVPFTNAFPIPGLAMPHPAFFLRLDEIVIPLLNVRRKPRGYKGKES